MYLYDQSCEEQIRMSNKLSYTTTFICMCIFVYCSSPNALFTDSYEEITLESAIQTAMQENLGLKVLREKVKVAQAQLEGIALLSNPELESEFIGGGHAEQVLEITKSFELGGQRGHRKQIARINLEKVNFELNDEMRKLRKFITLAFYQVVLNQEKLELTKDIIKHNQQMYEMVQFQFDAGDIPVSQVGLANIQLQSARREFATLENEMRLAQLDLNGLMGTPLEATPIASGKYDELKSMSLKLDDLKSRALAHRPDLKSLRLNLQLTESAHRLAKAANIPNLNIGGIAERSQHETALGVKFSIPLPLFDWNRSEIDSAKAQKHEDNAQITNTERKVVREVMAAYLSLNAAQQNLKFYDDNLMKLLNENLTLTRSAYELGEAQLFELILIQNEFVKTRFAYLDAIASYIKAFVELEAAIGTSITLVE